MKSFQNRTHADAAAEKIRPVSEQAKAFSDRISHRSVTQKIMWRDLRGEWNADAILDVTVEVEHNGDELCGHIDRACSSQDARVMLVLIDLAEESGVDSEFCRISREAIRRFHPEV